LSQRLDKWLVYARFVKHRSLAAELIEHGKVRINKERAAKCSQNVKPADILTISLGERVKVVRVLGESERRGSATLASQLYEDLTLVENSGASDQPSC
jgi:ribosome-associated heat shock protein Hsp15